MVKDVLIWLTLGLCLATTVHAAPLQLQGKDLFSNRSVQIRSGMSRPMVVVFMSARCPCSASHEPVLKPLVAEFPDYDFVGVHANSDEPESETREHFQKAAFPFPLLEDVDGSWAKSFEALKTPHAFIVDTRGQILYSGGITDSSHGPTAQLNYLKLALSEFKTTGKIKESKRRALGCIISRRTKS